MKKRRERMDELDIRLLAALAEDPTQSYSLLKEKVGVSIGTVYLRLNRLKEWGVIRGAQLLLEPKKLGYSFVVMVRLHVPDTAAAIKALEARPEVSSAYILTGELNLLVYAYLRDVNELHGLLQFLRQSLHANRTEVQIVLDEPIRRGVPLPPISEEVPKSRAGRTASTAKKSSSSRGKKK